MLIYIILTREGVKNAKRISNPPLVHFDSRWRDHLNAISLRTEWLDVALFLLLLFSFTYLYFLYLFYLFLYCFYLLSIINLLFLLIILGFWGVLMFWIWVCLGLGSINVGISMVVGIFGERILGVVIMLLGELEVGWKWLKGLGLWWFLVVGRG